MDIKRHREVTRKDNFFGVQLFEGERLSVAVDGEIVVDALVPVDCDLNGYMKRKPVSFQFK